LLCTALILRVVGAQLYYATFQWSAYGGGDYQPYFEFGVRYGERRARGDFAMFTEPTPWGLAFEIRDEKRPHWTGERNSPRTFGHFGGGGTFLWVDPEAQLALGCLTDREITSDDVWIKAAWPRFSDAVLSEAGSEQP
jgi:CubicO group peptidase (beta-lactamase class C family)